MSLAELIFTVKGLLALAGVLLLVWHIDRCWGSMRDRAQKARYLCLLGFGVLLAGASAEQLTVGSPLELRHWGSLTMSAALAATALYSIRKSDTKEK